MDKSIEAAARAISVALLGYEDEWERYAEHARAAIAAYRDAEIERLNENIKTLLANHQAVRAKIEAAERDAERYRWLRDESIRCPDTNTPTVIETCEPNARMIDGLALDRAVDAARNTKE